MLKGRWRSILVVSAAVMVVFALPATADVDNGGFESPTVANAAGWDIFTSDEIGDWDVAWAGAYVGAPTDANLEIHRGVNGWLPYEGDQYVELDTDWDGPGGPTNNEQASVVLSQVIDTPGIGYNYDFSYAWSPRPSHANNAMEVRVDGAYFDDHSGPGVGNTSWTLETGTLVSTGATLTLEFEETGTPDSFGMFLDDVTCTFCVSTTTSELQAGRDGPYVGDVTVSHDDEYIYVEFTTDDPWVVYKTHVEVVDDASEFPQNKGGLIPGLFTYGSGPHVPGETNDTIEIPIPDGPGTYFVAFHAELLEVSVDGPYWASEVIGSDQGLRKDGTAVLLERSDPADALGEPDGQTTGVPGFFSLGFGGWIELAFDGWIYNSASPNEFAGVEITGGAYPAETAKVEFFFDGQWYLAAGQLINGGGTRTTTYVQLPDEIPYAEMVRITDTTNAAIHNAAADGFDLDAVKALNLVLSEETGWADTHGEEVGNNWSMYFAFDFNCPE
jgi:hypothetical protein